MSELNVLERSTPTMTTSGRAAPAAAAAAAAAAGVAAVVIGALITRRMLAGRAMAQQLRQLQGALAHEQEKRAADRAGRIRAEQRLKQLRLELAVANTAGAGQHVLPQQQQQQHGEDGAAQAEGIADSSISNAQGSNGTGGAISSQQPVSSMSVFPVTAIGTLRSCFSSRTGTPRQPHLVPAARAVLRLAPGIPPSCLEGLQHFSHCWVLYVFHENTDLAKLLAARAHSGSCKQAAHSAGVKSHVKVPRLNGGKMGVLATRSPHRPVPIGLSTAQVLEVDAAAGVLVLGGVDIVDGSPVLDVKPYVPFSDALEKATAPHWVTVEADEEPLALGDVIVSQEAQQQLTAAWQAVQRRSLYSSPRQLMELVEQVLARDIRSLHQRTNVLPVKPQRQKQLSQQQAGQQQHVPVTSNFVGAHAVQGNSGSRTGGGGADCDRGRYAVGLDGVCVEYDICSETGRILVRGAHVGDAHNVIEEGPLAA